MFRTLILIVLFLPVVKLQAAVGIISLSEAIKTKMVKFSASNTTGAYQGKTTTVILANNSRDVLKVKIDVGTILTPDSSSYQPMILAGEELLVLQPSGSASMLVQTFCGNSPKSCPSRGHGFRYSGIGSDTLVTVMKFVKANNLFDDLGQYAVWALTNNASLSNIYDSRRPHLSNQLLEVICKATGRQKPDYYTINAPSEQVPDMPAYVPKPLKIVATFRLITKETKRLTLGVYNDVGNTVQSVFEDREFPATGHEFGVEFEAADVPAGFYYIRLKEGDTVLEEKRVKVE